jgi:hypothetical protein
VWPSATCASIFFFPRLFVCLFCLFSLSLAQTLAAFCAIGKSMAAAAAATFGVMLLSSLSL